MIAGRTGMAPGTARASGNTTRELRVPALKATARPAAGLITDQSNRLFKKHLGSRKKLFQEK